MSVKNCDVVEGESVRVDGPCVVRYVRRKSTRIVVLSITADRSVRIRPESQSPMPNEENQDFSQIVLATDDMPVV